MIRFGRAGRLVAGNRAMRGFGVVDAIAAELTARSAGAVILKLSVCAAALDLDFCRVGGYTLSVYTWEPLYSSRLG